MLFQTCRHEVVCCMPCPSELHHHGCRFHLINYTGRSCNVRKLHCSFIVVYNDWRCRETQFVNSACYYDLTHACTIQYNKCCCYSMHCLEVCKSNHVTEQFEATAVSAPPASSTNSCLSARSLSLSCRSLPFSIMRSIIRTTAVPSSLSVFSFRCFCTNP